MMLLVNVWDDKPKPKSDIQIYHCHNDHLGTPNELTTHEGEVVWLADYEAYGNTAKVVWREEQLGQIQVSSEELQPIRFQGEQGQARVWGTLARSARRELCSSASMKRLDCITIDLDTLTLI